MLGVKKIDIIRWEGRSWARKRKNGTEISYSGSRGKRTLVHQLGHAIEHNNPTLKARAQEHIRQRALGERLRPMNDFDPHKTYGADEVTRADEFVNPYIRKEAASGNTELVSMGLEMMVMELAATDPRLFDFIFNEVLRG